MADINFIPQNPILMITTISKGRKADRAARREDTMVARSAAILPVTSLILHSIMTCEAPEIKAIIEITTVHIGIEMLIIIIMDQKQNPCPSTLHSKTEMLNMEGEERQCQQLEVRRVLPQCFIALR